MSAGFSVSSVLVQRIVIIESRHSEVLRNNFRDVAGKSRKPRKDQKSQARKQLESLLPGPDSSECLAVIPVEEQLSAPRNPRPIEGV